MPLNWNTMTLVTLAVLMSTAAIFSAIKFPAYRRFHIFCAVVIITVYGSILFISYKKTSEFQVSRRTHAPSLTFLVKYAYQYKITYVLMYRLSYTITAMYMFPIYLVRSDFPKRISTRCPFYGEPSEASDHITQNKHV